MQLIGALKGPYFNTVHDSPGDPLVFLFYLLLRFLVKDFLSLVPSNELHTISKPISFFFNLFFFLSKYFFKFNLLIKTPTVIMLMTQNIR